VTGLVLDAANPSTLYASTNTRGVFRTVDGGISWSPLNAGLDTPASLKVTRVTIDPTNNATCTP